MRTERLVGKSFLNENLKNHVSLPYLSSKSGDDE